MPNRLLGIIMSGLLQALKVPRLDFRGESVTAMVSDQHE